MNGYVHQRKNMTGAINVQCHKFDCDGGTLHVDSVNNRVGVGTKTPSAKLDVNGSINVTGNIAIDTNTLYVDSTNNRVGICTSSPSNTLETAGDIYMSGTPRSLWIGGNTDASAQKIRLHQNGTSAYIDITGDSKFYFRSGTTPSIFATLDGTNKRLYIGGTSSPSYPLDVAGSVNITSTSAYKISGTDVLASGTLNLNSVIYKGGTWSTSALTTHYITNSTLSYLTSTTSYWIGKLTIFVTDNSSKVGTYEVVVSKLGATAYPQITGSTKVSNFTTLDVTNYSPTNNYTLVVTTDVASYMTWSFTGADK